MKKLTLALAALLSVAVVSGCNTIQGVGKDVERAGEKVQDAAQKSK
jgi:predicted small secreted protein